MSKAKKLYTAKYEGYGGFTESKLYKRKHDAARTALIHKGTVIEYTLTSSGEFLIFQNAKGKLEYIPMTEEAKLLYGK